MNLDYLDFDYSEDADGHGTFDAMASVPPAQVHRLQADIAAVLQWAHRQFPDACGPEEDGGEWQYDLQGTQETRTPLSVQFDVSNGRLETTAGTAQPPLTTLSLSLSGTPRFCDALRAAFQID